MTPVAALSWMAFTGVSDKSRPNDNISFSPERLSNNLLDLLM